MEDNPRKRRLGRRQVVPLVWGVSLLSIVVLGLGITGTLSGFTATIVNNNNTEGTGSVVMEEAQGGTTCFSSSVGSTISVSNSVNCNINKLGGNLLMIPGTSSTETVVITNIGTVPVGSAFTLTPAGCTTATANGNPSGADTGGFCGKVDVTINDDTDNKCIFPTSGSPCGALSSSNTLSSLGTTAIDLLTPAGGSIAATNGTRTYTIKTQIDSSATNADQALQVSENLTWQFTA